MTNIRALGRAAFAAAKLMVLSSLAVSLTNWGTPSEAATVQPNIVMVLTDDMSASLLDQMPNIKSLIKNKGATFTHAYFNDPLCQPSRATTLSGRYDQNSGAIDNNQASYRRFVSDGTEGDTVAVWLRNAGYRTAFIGKYMNGYAGSRRLPPGWTYFAGRGGGGLYYNYKLNENGKVVSYGSATADYSTSVFERKALAFLNQPGVTGSPFFLLVAPDAPHFPTQVLSSDLAAVPSTLKVPQGPAFNEADSSDKPSRVRNHRRLNASRILKLDASYRREAAALRAVDRLFLHLYQKLQAAGVADRTYFVFASDNGWMWGDHRITTSKGWEYDQVDRNPLVVAGPGIAAGSTIDALVNNADYAPTFAEWAGAKPGAVDGRSLVPLFGRGNWTRQSMPADYRFEALSPTVPTWRGVMSLRYAYAFYPDTSENELYNLASDPYRLTNIGPTSGATVTALRSLADQLNRCSGAACRALEDRPLP